MKRGYVDVPEGQVHYRTEGSGDTIILLHMASSSSGEYSRVIPFLSKTHRAIAMDFLGFGESDPAPREYLVEDHARIVLNVMDTLSIEKANIAGHHTGAEIGVEIAVTHPERVDKLALSCLPFFKTEEDFISHSTKSVFQPVEMQPDGGHLMEWWRRSSRYGDPMEMVDERALDFHKAGPRGEELHKAAFAYVPKLREKLPLIKCPTLVTAGTLDHFCPVQQEVKKLIPRSKLAIIEGGSVLITRVMPEEFAEAILNFLENPGK